MHFRLLQSTLLFMSSCFSLVAKVTAVLTAGTWSLLDSTPGATACWRWPWLGSAPEPRNRLSPVWDPLPLPYNLSKRFIFITALIEYFSSRNICLQYSRFKPFPLQHCLFSCITNNIILSSLLRLGLNLGLGLVVEISPSETDTMTHESETETKTWTHETETQGRREKIRAGRQYWVRTFRLTFPYK